MNIYIYMNKMPSDIWAQNYFKVSDLLAEKKNGFKDWKNYWPKSMRN